MNNLRETELLCDIAARLGTSADVDAFLADIIGPFATLVGADRVGIWLPDLVQARLIPRHTYGLPKKTKLPDWHIDDEGIIATVYRIGATFFSKDVFDDDRLIHSDVMKSLGFTSMIAMPIVARQQIEGVIAAASERENAFQEDQLDLVRAVAGQIGMMVSSVHLHTDLRRRAEFMDQINRVGRDLTAMLDLDTLSEHVVAIMHRDLKYPVVYLWLRDGPTLTAHARAVGDTVTLLRGDSGHPITEGIVGRTARTARSYIARDLGLDPDYVAPDELPDMRSCLTVPIKSGEMVIGVLQILSSELATFDEVDRQAMETLAAQAAIAMENARLYKVSQKRVRQQAIVHQISQDLNAIFDVPSLADAIVYQMAHALDTTGCALYLYDSRTNILSPQAYYVSAQAANPDALEALSPAYSLNELPMMRQAVLMGTPVTIGFDSVGEEIAEREILVQLKQHTALVVPLVTGGRPLGLIMWLEDRHPRTFSETEIRMAQTLANHAAVTLDHARLHDEAQRQLRRETALRRVAEAAHTWVDQKAMLERYAREVNTALQTSVCNIYTLAEGEILTLAMQQVASGAPPPVQTEEYIDLEAFPAMRDALDEGIILCLALEEADPALPESGRLRDMGYNGMMLAPLIYRERLVGALEVLDDRIDHRFTADETTLMEALASQLSIAVDNARLYANEQQRRTLLEHIQRTSQAIAGELQLGSLLSLVVEQVAGVFDVDAACVVMRHTDDEDEFRVEAGYGLSDAFVQGMHIPAARFFELHGGEYTGRVFTDIKEVASIQPDLFEQEDLRTFVSIPLLHGHEVTGSLCLGAQGRKRDFSDHELEMARLLARQIAIAINNAQLFEVLEERAAELAKANLLKNEFLANISHELRTPMNSIIGFSQSLLAGIYGDLNEKQQSRLEIVMRNAHHLLDMIDDLLDLARIESGRMQLSYSVVDTGGLLRAVSTEHASKIEAKGLVLLRKLEDELPFVNADEQRLRQILDNLISNATKFTAQGSVTIAAWPEEEDGESYVHFMVKDTGIGIAQEDLDVVFDAFRQVDGSLTREYEGTGMGLAITRELVLMMNGRIWVESIVGRGSEFHVLIPVAGSAAKPVS